MLPGLAVRCGLYLLAFALLAALTRRPLFAAALLVAAVLLAHLVSQAKRRVLREPLVFSDLRLFSQALRHPRLYLPYLGTGRAVAAVVAIALAAFAGLYLEAAGTVAAAPLAGVAVLGAFLLFAGSRTATLALQPEADVRRHGLVASLWLYWLAARRTGARAAEPFATFALVASAAPAPIVVVQSESFFDPRRLHGGIADAVMANFDAMAREGECGRLAVPVWGAYTMRTEFAFLSGIAPEGLGVHRFDPYARYARQPVATMASRLRAAGYRTIALHPYPARFFRRDRVFPQLGFDEFLDARAFAGARREGAYVADAEVAARIVALLARSREPLFIFAITMENHGPLHLEPAPEAEARRLYREPPPPAYRDLTAYLRHVANADAALGTLRAALPAHGAVLCLYGDHVPGMPEVYAAAGHEDPDTDYLIWRPGGLAPGRSALRVENLACRVLEAAGLAAARA
jgi:phosphoglycerol transferase MdoB-like AlkP superfamily enzyme